MRYLILTLALLSLGLGGCKDRTATEPSTTSSARPSGTTASIPTPQKLLNSPLAPTLVELPTDTLPLWRQFKQVKPTLVLLSQDPLLAPVPSQLREDVLNLLREGSREEIAAGVNTLSADPLLTPSMALSAALEAGYFSRVVWVFPSTGATGELKVETFRSQLRELGAVDENEENSFTRTADGVFSGTLRGVPFQAVHPDALPVISEPVVLHIDLTYFQPLYKGEIKTPLYPLTACAKRSGRPMQ